MEFLFLCIANANLENPHCKCGPAGVEVLNIQNISTTTPINISNLADGIYNISINSDNKIYNSKFIKQ